jgi:hypothetical protein
MDDLMETREYWKLKEDVLGCTVWITLEEAMDLSFKTDYEINVTLDLPIGMLA